MKYDINGLQPMNVSVTDDYAVLRLYWETPEPVKGNESYIITVQGRNEGEFADLYESEIPSGYLVGSDYVSYVCQESGFFNEMRFIIVALSDGKPVACYIGEPFDPRRFYPEKKELIFGEDIKLEDIESFTWSCNGTTAESNYSYYVEFDGKKAHITRTNVNGEKSRIISRGKWNKLLEYIAKGKLVRKRAGDPEIIELDGSDDSMSVTWAGITELQRNSYSLHVSQELRGEIIKHLKSIVSPALMLISMAAGGMVASVTMVRRLLKVRKK